MKTLIAGCGYLGTFLGKALLARGDQVWGLRRNTEALESTGIIPVKADLLDPSSLKDLPVVDRVVACQAPRRGEDYKGTYYDGTRNLLGALKARSIRHFVFVSSTSVYATADGSWVDEITPPLAVPHTSKEDSDNAHFLLGAEKAALGADFPATALRLGGLYGPGRHRLKMLKEGKMTPSFSDSVWVNRVRVEDAAAAVGLLLEKGESGAIYLGVDDEPTTQNEFYSWLYERLGVSKPSVEGSGAPHGSNKRCSNRRLRALGWRPAYPTFREGYADLLAEARTAS